MEIRYETKAATIDCGLSERERRVAIYADQIAAHTVRPLHLSFDSALARPVECVETKQRFECVAEAARATGISPACIRNAIRTGGRTWKVRFRYVAGAKGVKVTNRRARAVVCVESGERFESLTAAAKAHGLPVSTIYDAVKLGKPARGRRYQYAPTAGDRLQAA